MDNEFCDCKVRARSFTIQGKSTIFYEDYEKRLAHTAFEFLAPDCKTFFSWKKKSICKFFFLYSEQLLVSDQMQFHFSKPSIFDDLLKVFLEIQVKFK